MRRYKEQIMGFWLNEPAILDHDKIRHGIINLAESGYGIIRLMLRNSNFTHSSPEVINAVAVAVETGHQHKVKVVYDSEPHQMVGRDMGSSYPDAIGSRLVRTAVQLLDGHFKLHVQAPGCVAKYPIYDKVEAAFIEHNGTVIKLDQFKYDFIWEKNMYEDGNTAYRHDFRAHANVKGHRHIQLSGKLEEHQAGKLIVYSNFKDIELTDFASFGSKAYYHDLVDCFKHIALDGFCWDEPAYAGDWTNYRYGAGFAEYFEKLNGYALQDKLYLLDNKALSHEAIKVRMDYYHTLNEAMFESQRDFIEYAEKVYGKKLIKGTHHTWQGEGGANDYRAGAIDYFRLNDNMDVGYTDCCWWDQKSVAYSYILGSSLGRLTPSGEAECNTWHWKPTNAQIQYNARLMSLMDITWFNIWYGDNADTCMYPSHYTWNTTVAEMQQHKEFQLLLQGTQPVVDVAVLHDWTTIAGMNDLVVANLHKAFCMNLAKMAIDNNIAFDFIDDRLLQKSEVVNNQLQSELGIYKILVIPFATIIADESWKLIKQFISQGGKVIFTGPPPTMTISGMNITDEFAELMNINKISAEKYMAWFKNCCTSLPQYRPDEFDPAYPVNSDCNNILFSVENEIIGAVSKDNNCIYFSEFEAASSVINQLKSWHESAIKCYSESIMYRLYKSQRGSFLMLIARENQDLSGIVNFNDHALLFEAGKTACIMITTDNELHVSGDRVKYKPIALRHKNL